MKILCNIVTGTIKDLAKQLGKSDSYTCNLVSVWQTKNQSNQYPTIEQLRELLKSSKQELLDTYFAVPNYEIREYNPNVVPIEHVGNTVYLMKFPEKNPMEHFFKIWDKKDRLKDVIRNTKEAYQYILWREMAFIQKGLSKSYNNRDIAENEAYNKALEYAKRNPIEGQSNTENKSKEEKGNTQESQESNNDNKKLQSDKYKITLDPNNLPHIGTNVIKVNSNNTSARLAQDFSAIERDDRINMIAREFSNIIDRLIDQKIDSISKEINDEMSKENPDKERIQLLNSKLQLFNDSNNGRKALLTEVGPLTVFNILKETYKKYANMSEEEFDEDYGKGQGKRMLQAYQKIVNNFDALLNEATIIIENNENLRIIPNEHTFHNGEHKEKVLDADMSMSAEDNITNEKEFNDDEDGKRTDSNGGWSFKVRLVDPRTSLSKKTKKILSNIKKVGIDGLDTDDLGNTRYLSGDTAYNILMNDLSGMIDANDFVIKQGDNYRFPALEKMQDKYPWISQVINTLKAEPEYISSFFADFRKDFIPYSTQYQDDTDSKWKDKQLNASMVLESTLSNIIRNYEQNNKLDTDSLYISGGKISNENADKGVSLTNNILTNLKEDYIDKDTFDTIARQVSKGLRMLGLNTHENIIHSLLNTDNGIIELTKVVNAMKDIFSGVKDLDSDFHLIDTFSGEYNTIAQIVGEVTDLDNVSSFRQGDKSYYSYSAPNYVDTMLKIFKNDNRRQSYIDNEFKKYDWFYHNGKWSNEWLNLIENDENVRYQMRFEDMNTINGIEYTDWTPQLIKDTFIRKYFSAGTNKGSKDQFGWYNFPIFSDSPVVKFIKFKRYINNFQEQLLPLFREVVMQELRRIKLVQERQKSNSAPIANFDTNGLKFNFFPEFNIKDEQGKSILDNIIELSDKGDLEGLNLLINNSIMEVLYSQFNEFILDYIDENGKLTSNGENLQQSLITNGIISNGTHFISALEEYFWNQAYATTQIIELTTTDLAYYKDDIDFQKRYKEVYAAGTKLNTNSTYGREFEKTIYLVDNIITSNSYNNVKKSLQDAVDSKHISKIDMENILKSFRNINVTDAQAFRSLDSLRAVLDMMGAWTPEMQSTMDRIENGEWNMADFNTVWQTIKPFVFTQIEKPDGLGGVIKVPHQNKNSEFLVLAMYNMIANSLQSPKMKAINRFMKENNIDVIQFESAVKAGKQGVIDINYSESKLSAWAKENNKIGDYKSLQEQFKNDLDNKLIKGSITQEEYNNTIKSMEPSENEVYEMLDKYSKINGQENPEVVHTIPYSDYVIQQPTPEHLLDEEAVFGSQFRNLIIADLPDNPDFRVTINNKEYTKQQVLDLYKSILVENLLDDYESVKKKFTNIHNLQKALLENIKGNPKYGRDMTNALQIVTITNPITGEREEVFNIPLDNPTTTLKIQELVTSMFKNKVTKQHIKGGSCILVSSFGYTDELHVQHNGDGSIKYVECYLPAYSRDMFAPFMEEKNTKEGNKYMELDINNLPESLRKIIGYRIPTEDAYSMAPLYIKGFMPQQNGSAVMLPADTTVLAGEDYDVDKKFLMIPEFRVYTQDMRVAKRAFEKENALISSMKDQFKENSALSPLEMEDLKFKEWWNSKTQEEKNKFKYEKPLVEKVRYNHSVGPEGNSRAARNNMLIDIAYGILTNKSTAEKIHNPGSFNKVKQTARLVNILKDMEIYNAYKNEFNLRDDDKVIDKLLNSSLKELDDFMAKYRKPNSQLTLNTFIHNHKQNMTGGALIGMFANNTSMQAKYQHTNLAIKNTFTFFINGRRIKSLHNIMSERGERISKNCAEFSAASVDNVKDPVLADLMQTTETANITGLMLRAGLTIQEIGLLFTQPIVRKCIEETGSLRTLSTYINRALKEINDNNGSTTILWQSEDYTTKELIKNIIDKHNTYNMSSEEYVEYLTNNVKAAMLMKNIADIAKTLNALTQISRADSPNGAIKPSIAGAKNQTYRVNNFLNKSKSKEFPLVGIESVIRNDYVTNSMDRDNLRDKFLKSGMPILQAFYSLGIELGVNNLSPYFSQTSDYVNNLVQELNDNHPNGMLSDKLLNTFYEELIEFGLSKTSLFGNDDKHTFDEKRDYYLYNYPKQFLTIKANNPDIAELSAIKKMEVVNGNIIMRNSGKLTPLMKDTIMRDLDTLLYMDNPEAQQLAVDLFMYSYYKDGFKFGPNNYGSYFSTEFLNSFPEFISALRIMKYDMKSGTYFDNYLSQFYANHWSELLPLVDIMNVKNLNDGSILVPVKNVFNRNYPKSNIRSWKAIKVYDYTTDSEIPYVLNRDSNTEAHYVPMITYSDSQGAKYNANMTVQEMSKIEEDTQRIKEAKELNNKANNKQEIIDDNGFDEDFSVIDDTINDDFLAGIEAMEQSEPYSEEEGESQLDKPLCK